MNERKRDYDFTVAHIAGNIAAGLVTKEDANGAGVYGVAGLTEWMKSVTLLSVGLARAIVEEVRRTEPVTSALANELFPIGYMWGPAEKLAESLRSIGEWEEQTYFIPNEPLVKTNLKTWRRIK